MNEQLDKMGHQLDKPCLKLSKTAETLHKQCKQLLDIVCNCGNLLRNFCSPTAIGLGSFNLIGRPGVESVFTGPKTGTLIGVPLGVPVSLSVSGVPVGVPVSRCPGRCPGVPVGVPVGCLGTMQR